MIRMKISSFKRLNFKPIKYVYEYVVSVRVVLATAVEVSRRTRPEQSQKEYVQRSLTHKSKKNEIENEQSTSS
jgi:hypothetical protein